MIILRAARAEQTLQATEAFVNSGLGNPLLAERARQIGTIIHASEALVVSRLDANTGDTPTLQGLVRMNQREDSGLMPARTSVFQALPTDPKMLPRRLMLAVPGIREVVNKETVCVVKGYGAQGGPDEQNPHMIFFASFDHPFARALAGSQAFCRVAQAVHEGIPLAHQPPLGPEARLQRGSQLMALATIVTDTLSETDAPTAEWVSASANWWQGVHERKEPETGPPKPPAGTPVADALEEPLMIPLINRSMALTALRQMGQQQDRPEEWPPTRAQELVDQQSLGFPL